MYSYSNPYILKLINMQAVESLYLSSLYLEAGMGAEADTCLRHSKMLRDIYNDLGGDDAFLPLTHLPDVRDIGPLRTVYFALKSPGHKNALFEIITDRLLLAIGQPQP